jgi:hypothetical protein
VTNKTRLVKTSFKIAVRTGVAMGLKRFEKNILKDIILKMFDCIKMVKIIN